MVEADRAADQRGRGAAVAVAEDLVAVADDLALELEDPRGRRAGLAAQDVALAVRDEREVAAAQRARLGAAGLQPHLAGRDDVEPDVAGHGHQRQAPRRGQLGAAVERAVHAQEVERLPERVGGRPWVEGGHVVSMRPRRAIVHSHGRSSMSWRSSVIDSPRLVPDAGRHAITSADPPRPDPREPRERRADHVPRDRLDDRRRAGRHRPRAPGRPSRAGPAAHPPAPGGALRGRRRDDALPARPRARRRRTGRGGRRAARRRARLRERGRHRRARPRGGPPGAEDGAAVRDRGRAGPAGAHAGQRRPQAAGSRALHRASSTTRCARRSRPAGCSAPRWRRSPGSPGSAAIPWERERR